MIMNQKKEILEKLAFIRRHKEFASFGVKEQEVSYNPCLSEEDIKEFEHKHCITLPDDYRTFISEIGNGGFGPGYGLLPLDKAIVDFKLKDKPNISLNKILGFSAEDVAFDSCRRGGMTGERVCHLFSSCREGDHASFLCSSPMRFVYPDRSRMPGGIALGRLPFRSVLE